MNLTGGVTSRGVIDHPQPKRGWNPEFEVRTFAMRSLCPSMSSIFHVLYLVSLKVASLMSRLWLGRAGKIGFYAGRVMRYMCSPSFLSNLTWMVRYPLVL